jgi:hypothetical protein
VKGKLAKSDGVEAAENIQPGLTIWPKMNYNFMLLIPSIYFIHYINQQVHSIK